MSAQIQEHQTWPITESDHELFVALVACVIPFSIAFTVINHLFIQVFFVLFSGSLWWQLILKAPKRQQTIVFDPVKSRFSLNICDGPALSLDLAFGAVVRVTLKHSKLPGYWLICDHLAVPKQHQQFAWRQLILRVRQTREQLL